MPSLKYFKLLY